MSIPSSQIETWSRQGAITTSSATYGSIKKALTSEGSPVASMITSGAVKFDLQGSYAHDTNIYGDSDVDVIVWHTATFDSNKLELPPDQYHLHEQHYPAATYDWNNLRRDVITALTLHYGHDYVDIGGKKSLKVLPVPGRLRIDVVPAITYRRYSYFQGPENHNHSREDGVTFNNAVTGERIINYPSQHYDNAVAKHAATDDHYKAQVRIFKNMRSCLVERGFLTKEEAPSYFIQGMVYNIPNNIFVADRAKTTLEILRSLRKVDLNSFISQNGQHPLFGDTTECWNLANATKTIEQLCFLWDNWYKI